MVFFPFSISFSIFKVVVPKAKGEILGVVIVESGWGSMLPTIVLANLLPGGPAARCGQLNIGDQVRITLELKSRLNSQIEVARCAAPVCLLNVPFCPSFRLLQSMGSRWLAFLYLLAKTISRLVEHFYNFLIRF